MKKQGQEVPFPGVDNSQVKIAARESVAHNLRWIYTHNF